MKHHILGLQVILFGASLGCRHNELGVRHISTITIGTRSLRSSDPSCYFEIRFERIDCGYPGITKSQCERRACCFDDTYPDANNCFYRNSGCLEILAKKDPSSGEIWYDMTNLNDLDSRRSGSRMSSFRASMSMESGDMVHAVVIHPCTDDEMSAIDSVMYQMRTSLQSEQGPNRGQIDILHPRWSDAVNPIGSNYRRLLGYDSYGRGVYRVEHIQAVIERRGPRVDFPSGTIEYMRNYLEAIQGDEAFHLVASSLSGPPELYNMIPARASINRNYGNPGRGQINDWFTVERDMREFIGSGWIEWTVHCFYNQYNSGRPDGILYAAKFVRFDGSVAKNIIGFVENRDI